MNSSVTVAPSLLATDFAHISEEVASVVQAGADWLHLDVMDGTFVPPISFGSQFVQSVRSCTQLPLDVHLMTEHPQSHFQTFAEAGATAITFHVETCVHSHRFIQQLKDLGVLAGISLVPSTPVHTIVELLPIVDLVLVMTVNPGYGGQQIIPSCINKITQLSQIRSERRLAFRISVDGGVTVDNSPTLVRCGADILVAGSTIFNASDRKKVIEKLHHV